MRSKIFACHEKEYLNILKINPDSICLVLVVIKSFVLWVAQPTTYEAFES